MRKTINFPKIDYNRNGRRINPVTVEIRLDDLPDGRREFACSACVWNSKKTDVFTAGQCLEELADPHYLGTNKKFMTILNLWRKYHLNTMHAGSERQEACLKANPNCHFSYDEDLAWLAKWGLVWDEEYKYGTSWLYREIPEKDMKCIIEIIEETEVTK